jgi:hypothetical protein
MNFGLDPFGGRIAVHCECRLKNLAITFALKGGHQMARKRHSDEGMLMLQREIGLKLTEGNLATSTAPQKAQVASDPNY